MLFRYLLADKKQAKQVILSVLSAKSSQKVYICYFQEI